eukprot:6331214-Prymnesium_polylepis.1
MLATAPPPKRAHHGRARRPGGAAPRVGAGCVGWRVRSCLLVSPPTHTVGTGSARVPCRLMSSLRTTKTSAPHRG